jgi:hypothetical protein
VATSSTLLKLRSSDPRFDAYLHWRKVMNFVFISSRQNIKERIIINQFLIDTRENFLIPIFPILIEKHYIPSMPGINSQIVCGILKAKYFIAILNEETSKIVAAEVYLAIKESKAKNIIIFVKENKRTKNNWRSIISEIQNKRIKYLPYKSIKEIKPMLSDWIKTEFAFIFTN